MSEADAYFHSAVRMGTVVAIRVVGPAMRSPGTHVITAGVARALAQFDRVEAACSRFEEESELRQLSSRIGTPVSVSPILFQAVQFALHVAAETGGAFDPTVGRELENRGFNRHYRSGQAVRSAPVADAGATWRDVRLDPEQGTITLLRPLLLDLGAVAKGLAIDLAARELQPFENFMIDAGGDVYLGGRNAGNKPWSVGIRHPRDPAALVHTVTVSDAAVCTSGDYERVGLEPGRHHLVDPRNGTTATAVASATVMAPTAMVADALATAAFVLGPVEGIRLLERCDVGGLIVTPALERFATKTFLQ